MKWLLGADESEPPAPDATTLKLDYEQTLSQFRLLADISFKLLAIVPTVAGASTVLSANLGSTGASLALGLLGFFVTIGVVFYEVRNSQFYDATVHRARALERKLHFGRYSAGIDDGGLFNEQRPLQRPKLFGRIDMWHDRGLGLVYGSALGAWSFIIAGSSLNLLGRRNDTLAILMAVVVAAVAFVEFHHLEATRDKPKPIA